MGHREILIKKWKSKYLYKDNETELGSAIFPKVVDIQTNIWKV